MELSANTKKRSNSNEEEMSGDDKSKVLTERDVGDIKLQPFIAAVNNNTLTLANAIQIVHILMGTITEMKARSVKWKKWVTMPVF